MPQGGDTAGSPGAAALLEARVAVRVRYNDCDPMGLAHHSVYPVWFEVARTELLRQQGVAYRDLESQGVFYVVVALSVRYRRPARYDDVLDIWVGQKPGSGVKVEHCYRVEREGELLAEGSTVLACVDRQGRPRRPAGRSLEKI